MNKPQYPEDVIFAAPSLPLYSMQRCRKNNRRYGKIHFAHHEFETLCGLETNEEWWVLTNRHDGDATCPKCIKVNDTHNNKR
jgi:hypothetical protein